ncbi:hypothetical protein AB4Z35_06570 [Pseudomonas sp. KB_15]|jgi:ABC-type antimicrobial peptide transport system permease subunit|uniref:hypothetical protein n=1 Tax=Pseudomonas sp. KB_15 TaxID=3233035 RepID=UPI003F9C374E
MTIAELVVGSLCGLVLVGLFLWNVTALYLAHTRMDLMLEKLKNCTAIMVRAPLRHGGCWGKVLLVGGISGIVTFPGFYLKRGELSIDDLQKFPVTLKRMLIVLQWSAIGLLTSLVLLVTLWKSGLLK